jgi:predicted glycogen debranching enzyme
MGIESLNGDNREFSYTNKRSAYYFSQTHRQDNELYTYFTGWNIATKRIFKDYQLFLEGQPLNREECRATVYPHQMVRTWPEAREIFSLFDDMDVLEIQLVQEQESKSTGIELQGEQVSLSEVRDNIAWFTSDEAPDQILGVAGINDEVLVADGNIVSARSGSDGFFILFGKDENTVKEILLQVRENREELKANRKDRMNHLINTTNYMVISNDSLDLALKWLILTMDQLITRQQGDGIYAGLPWFNEYWGRDTFIAFPGACLVTGQFDVARNILLSFAEYQNTDTASRYYGRVPNIVNPNNIDYHTTDGTPRFVIQLMEYVKYTGDTSIIRELYPVVERSIEGSLKNWVDEKGYLTHEDADTWMDARRNTDRQPYSPRGNRANDIQALWHGQLEAGFFFAKFMGETEKYREWKSLAKKIETNFGEDYKTRGLYLADHLKEDGSKDTQLRPNQFYALDVYGSGQSYPRMVRYGWENLVYPWGVASLSQKEENFHPYHLSWENYHKDEAYHNGTVWLWNNGIMMQRMIEAGQKELAYHLFKNMMDQALHRGAVGSLGENMDAYPQEGESWPKLTGTFLQAWSNSEHIRVWYQHFLGIQPDLSIGTLFLKPRIPEEINELEFSSRLGNGSVKGSYVRKDSVREYNYEFEGISAVLKFNTVLFADVQVEVKSGDLIQIMEGAEELILYREREGEMTELERIGIHSLKQEVYQNLEVIYKDIDFCRPDTTREFAAMQKTFSVDPGK